VSRRSHGRPTPSRGARVEQRKTDRGPATRMAIPDAILALAGPPTPPRQLPCLVDPACPIDHLHRKRGGRRG
jgi:hypothetical protein